ncbi:MAG: hypothetical protein RL557_897 [archaeon]|jgi:hypothetical protein
MEFDLQGRKPLYTTPDNSFLFVPNTVDGPHAYDVIIKGRDHFYIQDRTLSDLTSPDIPTETIMRSLEMMCGGVVDHLLKNNGLSSKDLHIALLCLRIVEQQREINDLYSDSRV